LLTVGKYRLYSTPKTSVCPRFEADHVLSSFFFLLNSPQWGTASSFMKFVDHTQRRTTFGRNPLEEWSARRRDLYLTTHNSHNRQTSMPPVGFEPAIPAAERPQTHALDCGATGTIIVIIGRKKYGSTWWSYFGLLNVVVAKYSNVSIEDTASIFRITELISVDTKVIWREKFVSGVERFVLHVVFFPVPSHVPYGLHGLPSRLWPKCNRLLRMGRPWGAVTLSRWGGWWYVNMKYQEGP
jgi:hypothetical protein